MTMLAPTSMPCLPRWATARSPERPTVGLRQAKLARLIGLPLMPHQRQVLEVAGELLPSGLPAYREVRVTIPRQNAKTSTLLVVEVDRALRWGRRQHVVYAAQDRISSRAKLEEQADILSDTALGPWFSMRRQTGFEQMIWPNGSTVGITASGKTSGHGRTVDLAVIDEAFAQVDWRLEQAFRPAMVTRPKAQLWICSTAGTDESVYLNEKVDDGRARVEAGSTSGVCYFEWSADPDADPDLEATWWSCMPALGHTVSVETIRADHDSMDASEFSRAYLNVRQAGGHPVIDAAIWARAVERSSTLKGMACFAVDVTPDRAFASVAVAGWRSDGRVHVELVEHRPGTEWVVGRVAELYNRWQPWPVIIDPASPAGSLLIDLAALGVPTETVGAREYAQACEQFYDAITGEIPKVAHRDQPGLNVAAAAARRRALGDAWAWARRIGSDVSPLVAVTLARWGLVKAGRGEPQIL